MCIRDRPPGSFTISQMQQLPYKSLGPSKATKNIQKCDIIKCNKVIAKQYTAEISKCQANIYSRNLESKYNMKWTGAYVNWNGSYTISLLSK